MLCTFYNSVNSRNKINKTLVNGVDKNIEFTKELDTKTPILLLSFDCTNLYNYVALNGKYYFIDSVKKVRENLYETRLLIDVLYTYKDTIKNFNCLIVESENPNPNKLDISMSNDYNISKISLNDVFDRNGKMYLTTVFKGV